MVEKNEHVCAICEGFADCCRCGPFLRPLPAVSCGELSNLCRAPALIW